MKNIFLTHWIAALDKLQAELNNTPEALLWQTAPGITNSCGTFFLHLFGNMNHFIGAQLGNTGYVRQREKEFSETGLSTAQLQARLGDVRKVVLQTLEQMPEEKFNAVFPLNMFGEGRTNADVLILLLEHLNYHVGQMNYLRRILAK